MTFPASIQIYTAGLTVVSGATRGLRELKLPLDNLLKIAKSGFHTQNLTKRNVNSLEERQPSW